MSLADLVARATHFSSDSRNVEAGGIFVALPGRAHDGHDFVRDVLARGVVGVVVRRGWPREAGLTDERLHEVDDLPAAHREIAGLVRRRFQRPVIAVGGSSGKTSTKEFLATLLAERFRVVKTDGSQNGELGIPKTLEKLRPGVECAIVEVGIDAPFEMIRHARLVEPNIACLTSIGEEHLERLGTVENVFREERILFDVTLEKGGLCFAPGSDAWLRRFGGVEGVVLTPADPTLYSARIARALRERLPNAYAVQNATLAAGVAKHLGLTEDEVLRGIAKLELPDGRGGLVELSPTRLLMTDHYNSNPSSLRAGLQSAAEKARVRKVPVRLYLGDMLDLGPQSPALHRAIVPEILGVRPESLVLVGPEFAALADEFRGRVAELQVFADSEAAAAAVAAAPARDGVHLVKGSRGIRMEKVVAALRAH